MKIIFIHGSGSPFEGGGGGDAILSYIPQRPPFVMVDKILSSGESSTRTSFIIHEKNIFVENGKFREPGLVENIAQTAAAGAGYSQQDGG
ncbi:MAG TPA: hypothetical protein VK498_02685, partial [Ferruginibacter sp.]|nr:hypothetical protein [Ferruginibacter sp.]